MTGHLVLSTLHTNDALSSVNRLLDMGVEGYLVTSTVIGIVAQRLVRQLCPCCRESYEVLPEMAQELQLPDLENGEPVKFYRAVGCEQCKGSGYKGRTAILEMLPMTDEIKALVLRHAEPRELRAAAKNSGMRSMYEDGLDKAMAGITSLEEVLRVTRAM